MAHELDPEEVDLAQLARSLAQRLGPRIAGGILGRTELRDEVVRQLDCSQLFAEELVDTLIVQHYVVEAEEPDGEAAWIIGSDPSPSAN